MMQSIPVGTNTLTVAVIEDQSKIRAGLQVLINGTAGYRCIAAFSSMEEALSRLEGLEPQVILLDIGLPGMSGIEGVPRLKGRCPGAAILILSVYDDDGRIFAALCAGADGYLLKNTPPARLLECLREVVDGGAPMSLEVARKVITLFRECRPPEHSEHELTPHETRVLRLLAEGHNYKTAAAKLGLSVNTVSFHMRRIYGKLHVHSKSEAVAKALRSGIVR
ncbi:MAG TPA: response regulator transcription factor [Bryobacteraceae bacterium]|nr:response regulator transcription factor [Bryobacteraceae bacterium]